MIYSFILLLWEFVISLMNIRAVTEEEFCLISTDMSARVESVDWHDDVKLVKLISDQLEVSVMIRAVHEPWRSFAVPGGGHGGYYSKNPYFSLLFLVFPPF